MADTRAGSIKFRKPRNRLPIGLLALVACVCLVCVIVFLGPSIGLSIPLSCDIRKTYSNPESPSSEPICAITNDKSTQEDVDPSLNGSQEATDVTAPGDTLISVLTDNLSDERSIKEIAQSLANAIQTSLSAPFTSETVLPAGRRYSITIDSEGRFLQAVLELEPAHVFHVARDDGGFRSWKEEVVLDFKTEVVCFKMKGSLTESLLSAGENLELALKLANVFRWDIDFHSESVKGDSCRVLFERRYADDRPSGYGRILGAVYDGKKTGMKCAVLFNNEYYDEKGVELKKNFLRSPLSVIRVTSRYGYRLHPVLKVWRKHNGVDYGASQGTPVWAVAGGVVTFAGWSNGYGNYVCIKHDSGFESRYGHLQRFFVAKGQRVKQRQRIGLVGMTGIATAPHLDFQLLVRNKHVNPLTVTMVKSLKTVPTPLVSRFSSLTEERLNVLKGIMLTKGSAQLTKLISD
jgi:murein DD-endopeptidase MepM/ murein hydrolase activator NlpD